MIGIWSTQILPIDYIDYTKHWPNVTDNSLRSDLSMKQAQHQTGTYARGFLLWNQYTDPIEDENVTIYVAIINLYTKQRQFKTQTK